MALYHYFESVLGSYWETATMPAANFISPKTTIGGGWGAHSVYVRVNAYVHCPIFFFISKPLSSVFCQALQQCALVGTGTTLHGPLISTGNWAQIWNTHTHTRARRGIHTNTLAYIEMHPQNTNPLHRFMLFTQTQTHNCTLGIHINLCNVIFFFFTHTNVRSHINTIPE